MKIEALFGHALEGDAPVRFIYVDEAGISAHESVTVVVGVIVHADHQWMRVARRILALRETVPEKLRRGFVSHAKQIWGDPKLRKDWSQEKRLKFLCDMLSIPWDYGLTVAWAIIPRNYLLDHKLLGETPRGYSKEQHQHAIALAICLAIADKYIRDRGYPGEVATVVIEDIPTARSHLRRAFEFARQYPNALTGNVSGIGGHSGHIPTLPDGRLDVRITRIVGSVHFAAKNEELLLEIADACAFALRRYHSRQSSGEEMIKAFYGEISHQFAAVDPALPSIGLMSGSPNPRD